MQKIVDFSEFSNPHDLFEALYSRFFRLVFSLAKCYHPGNAAEATAVFFEKKVWKAILNRKFHDCQNIGGLINISAKNYFKTIYRLNKNKQTTPIEDNAELTEYTDNPFLQIEFTIDFRNAMASLPENYRSVMVLSLEGYNEKVIAAMTSTTKGAVAQMKIRAKEKLRKFYTG